MKRPNTYSYVPEYPDNLLYDVIHEEVPAPEDRDGSIEYVIYTMLTPREAYAIHLRYGYGLTFKAIGERIGGVTPQRAREVVNKALRKLRHPSCSKYLFNGLAAMNDAKVSLAMEAARAVLRTEVQREVMSELYRDRVINGLDPKTIDFTQPIENLDFGVRAYNGLKRSGINTLGQLINKPYRELCTTPNLGKTSLEEIEARLRSMGLKLKDR